MNWIHSDDAVSVEKSLVEIEDYLQTKTKIEFRWTQKFDAFNVKMILIGSAAMAFSMFSGNFLFGFIKIYEFTFDKIIYYFNNKVDYFFLNKLFL